jgi:hypothetical protein
MSSLMQPRAWKAGGGSRLTCMPAHHGTPAPHHTTPTLMLNAKQPAPRCSASPAALTCPIGGVAQQIQPARRADPRSRAPRVEPQPLGLLGG